MNREPMNHKEWQQAMDAATKLLDNETARRYGLVNMERCDEIIEQGKKCGYGGSTGRTELQPQPSTTSGTSAPSAGRN